MVLELFGREATGLLVDDVPGEIEHVLGDLHVLDVVKVFLLAAHLVGVEQPKALPARSR